MLMRIDRVSLVEVSARSGVTSLARGRSSTSSKVIPSCTILASIEGSCTRRHPSVNDAVKAPAALCRDRGTVPWQGADLLSLRRLGARRPVPATTPRPRPLEEIPRLHLNELTASASHERGTTPGEGLKAWRSYLQACIELAASDLILKIDQSPRVRYRGSLKPLQTDRSHARSDVPDRQGHPRSGQYELLQEAWLDRLRLRPRRPTTASA